MFKTYKFIIILFLLLQQSIVILGQNYFVSNIYNNTIYTNPSYSLFTDNTFVQLNYRNQWPVNNLYSSYGVAYFHNIYDLSSNIGAIINYDSQYKGTFTHITLGLNYAYKVKINRESELLLGLNGSYNIKNTNYSGLTFENPNGIIPPNQNAKFPNVNIGAGLKFREEHFIGFSGNNLIPNSNYLEQPTFITANYIGHIKTKNYYSDVYFEPLINVATDFNKINFQYGANVDYSGLKAGLLINQSELFINTIVILLGFSFENLDFVYTYDLNLSGAVSVNPKMAAHEVTFLTRLQYKERRKRRGAIKCPDI